MEWGKQLGYVANSLTTSIAAALDILRIKPKGE